MGIGTTVDLAVAGQLDGRRLSSSSWAWMRGRVLAHPDSAVGPRGSGNHRLAARTCDAVAGLTMKSGTKRWRDPLEWLKTWYSETMVSSVGLDGFEGLSTEYLGAHVDLAMVNAHAGVPGAAEHLRREVALCSLHLTKSGRLIMPGGRSNRPERYELEELVRYANGEDDPRRPRRGRRGKEKLQPPGRELVLARRYDMRRWIDSHPSWAPTLAEVRTAAGVLVHIRFEGGFASYFESGPRCYSWPQNAVVAPDEGEPTFVRQPASGAGKVRVLAQTSIEDGALVTVAGDWRNEVSLRELGSEVARRTFRPAA